MKKPVLMFVVIAPLAFAACILQGDQGSDIIGSSGGPSPDDSAQVDGVPGAVPTADSTKDAPVLPDSNEPAGPLQVGGDVLAPTRLDAPQPRYTETAKTARIQGIVVAQTLIDNQGNVTEVKVLKGLPMGLNQEAIRAIRKWKFEPATLNGRPVSVYHNVTVNFFLP